MKCGSCTAKIWLFFFQACWSSMPPASSLEVLSRSWIPHDYNGTFDSAPMITFGAALTLNKWATYSTMGQTLKMAYEHYFDWLANAKGGISVGGILHFARLVLVDDNSSVPQTTYVTEQLVNWLHIDLFLGPYSSKLTEATADVIHRHGKLQVASIASNPAVFKDRPQVFGTLASTSNWLTSTFDALVEAGAGSGTTVAFVEENQNVLKAWCAHELPSDWKEVLRLSLPQPADFVSVVAELSSREPDIVVACVYAQACHSLLKEAWSQSYSPKAFVLTVCVSAEGFFDDVGLAGDYVIGMSPWSPILQHESSITNFDTQSWVNAHELEYLNAEATPGYHAASAFASCAVLIHAIEAANSTNPVDVANALGKVDQHTIYGRLRFDANGQSSTPMAVVQAQHGKSIWVRPAEVSTGLLRWPRPSVEDIKSMRCDGSMQFEDKSEHCVPRDSADSGGTTKRTILIIVALFAGLLVLNLCFFLCHRWRRSSARKNIPEHPLEPKSEIGVWVKEWVGPHVFGKLSEQQRGVLKRRASFDYIATASSSLRVTLSHSTSLRTPRWVINASPFVLVIGSSSCQEIKSYSACEFPVDLVRFDVKIIDVECESWMRLHGEIPLKFTIRADMWSDSGTEDADFRYKCPVARQKLPDLGTHISGDIKLIRDDKGNLVITWSPLHMCRGIPINEFETFLRAAYERDRDCNMYDVCSNMLLPEVTCFDASYAELMTAFGPPEVFISHVWREAVAVTLRAIQKLRSDYDRDFRVFFCTTCNNQSRVTAELGDDVFSSPFAQVLNSYWCTCMVMVSPFLALERKWCIFEWCYAGEVADKEILLLTEHGIVQKGQVAPKKLYDLANKLKDFDCNSASCSNPRDAELINDAVSRLGGYAGVHEKLNRIFASTVSRAHNYTFKALAALGTDAEDPATFTSTINLGSDPAASLATKGFDFIQRRPSSIVAI